MVRKTCFPILITFLVLAVNLCPVYSNQPLTLAILPFDTLSEKEIPYIQSGVLNMMYSRLYWKDHVDLKSKTDVKEKLAGLAHLSENERILALGENGWTDLVITGSITEYANAFSLDVKIYDIDSRSFLTFYDQTATLDQVIQKVDVICAKINKKAFDRTTVSFEKLKKEEIISEEELKRINPEKMMPFQKGRDQEEKKKTWWKIWQYLPGGNE